MSPRSEEYMVQARKRLEELPAKHPEVTVSLAYYAMLNAARGALSERDRYARTHTGTWELMRDVFVVTGELDAELVTRAQRLRNLREAVDYGATSVAPEDAETVADLARRFVAAIEDLIG